jgi:diguanylate cyclase (GGDEF)-like protein
MIKPISQASYVLIVEDLHGQRSIPLEEAQYSIGTHESNSIVIYSQPSICKRATLTRRTFARSQSNSFLIIDENSNENRDRQGIFINGEKCLVHELRDGDLIDFGGHINASYHVIAPQALMEKKILTFNRAAIDISARLTLDGQVKETLKLPDSSQPHSQPERTTFKPIDRDWLTGLSNRNLFNEHFSIALANVREKQQQLALIYLDLEHFETINDDLGYTIGDRLLVEFAKRLNGSLREGDILARWGGDEFVILLQPIKNPEDPTKVSQRILDLLKDSFVVEKHQVYLKCNIGIALYPQNGEDILELVKVAALNLKDNKKQRRHSDSLTLSKTRSFRGASADRTASNHFSDVNSQISRAESILRRAIAQKEFALDYQPQVNIHTGEIHGMEALLRWHHPKQGTIYPHQFLRWVEKTNLLAPIGEWVLQEACRQNQSWYADGLPRLPISVNLSPRQFQQANLIETIERVLEDTGLDPYWLELEITEAAILKDMNSARKTFYELSQLGVPVSLDDFGTGYTAIGYLEEFPFNKLKIDRTCVKKLQEYPPNTAAIVAAIALGYSFNLRVVAEGVETQQQVDALRQLQCQEMQGYRFSRPLNSQEATQFLYQHWSTEANEKVALLDPSLLEESAIDF